LPFYLSPVVIRHFRGLSTRFGFFDESLYTFIPPIVHGYRGTTTLVKIQEELSGGPLKKFIPASELTALATLSSTRFSKGRTREAVLRRTSSVNHSEREDYKAARKLC
jgi:hypothetical protein